MARPYDGAIGICLVCGYPQHWHQQPCRQSWLRRHRAQILFGIFVATVWGVVIYEAVATAAV